MTEEQIFLTALDLPTQAERDAYLDTACGADADLRRQVEALLAAHFQSGEFLDQSVGEQMRVKTLPVTIAETIYTPAREVDEAASADEPDDPLDQLQFLEPSHRGDALGRIGHYEVLQLLGKGGFGIVFRAFDEVLQRVVALKVLAPEIAATSPARKRFLREAQASARVRHENVVQVHAVEEKPLPYLVMEYIAGETLQQRLDRHGPLEVAEIVSLSRQIAEGLAAAHATGLIHRDIKPGNVLIEGGVQERVKITDFGLARAADDASMTQSGMLAGTPMYMAPEQAKGEPLDQRADLFSLGSVMYVMATGRPPFRAATTFAVLKRVVEETPRPIQDVIPELPAWLGDIIAKLHAKNPAERFQTAREVADVLAHCEARLKSGSRLHDIPRLAQRSTAGTGRGKWIAAAAAAVLLVPFGVLALTEIVGFTHLFRNAAASRQVNGNGEAVSNDPPAMAAEDAADWVQLFNGKDLTGWKTQPDAPGRWEVKNGILSGRERRSLLFSERGDYTNFHLRAEAKINLGGDSGIIFRTSFAKPEGPAGGYETEIHKNLNYARKTGSVAAVRADAAPVVLGLAVDDSLTQPDEWFTIELIADQNRFMTKVNGKVTANCRDRLGRDSSGHIALQVWSPNTVVQFRKIEIKELPSPASDEPAPHTTPFTSGEWIDVIPLIDPALDRQKNALTGANEWRIEKGELMAGYADDKPCKLLLPLDADWRAFECEVELTRRSGVAGINVNIPTRVGDCPVVFDAPNSTGIFLGRRGDGVVLNHEFDLATDERTRLRIEVRQVQTQDQVSVWVNDVEKGTWQGDRASIAAVANEGYPHARRMSLWVHQGGNELVFHRMRVRMLDGGTAQSLRPVPVGAPEGGP